MAAKEKKKGRAEDGLLVPFLAGAAAVLGAELGIRLYRDAKIFCPSPDPVKSWDPADYGIPAGAVEELWIRSGRQTLHAWYCRSATPRASALFCHGNTGNLTVSAPIIPHLLAAGLNVLFFDYRGFGRSTGRATVPGVLRDSFAAAEFHDRLRPPHLPSILYGFSLGGAIAAQVIRKHRFDALILQSTFTSLPHLTRLLHPGLPLHLLAHGLFDTLSVVRDLRVPLLVMHGTDDEVIPSDMAQQIHDACPGTRRMVRIAGGLHKDLYERDPHSLVEALREFIADLPVPART